MKASTRRKVIRWIHLVFSIPIMGMIYGPVADMPEAMNAIRFLFFPIILISGLWMWLEPRVKRLL